MILPSAPAFGIALFVMAVTLKSQRAKIEAVVGRLADLFHFDEFEDFWPSSLCEFDRAGHGASVKSG
jgi:hypothetical protein